MLDIINNDFRIYDEKPGEGYITGYVIQVFVGFNQLDVANLKGILQRKDMNVYAYIPTNYPGSDTAACGIAYVVFASMFEMLIAHAKMISTRGKFVGIKCKMFPQNPVWFHKVWVMDSYDPTMYDTDAKKYMYVKNRGSARHIFDEKEIAKWRKAWAKETKRCYEPKAPDTETCKNSTYDFGKPCLRCPLSQMADRYDSYGRCVIKKKDMV